MPASRIQENLSALSRVGEPSWRILIGTEVERTSSNLDTRSDCDAHDNLHLALASHPDACNVLGSIADQGKQDQADERLGDRPTLACFVNGSDQII